MKLINAVKSYSVQTLKKLRSNSNKILTDSSSVEV